MILYLETSSMVKLYVEEEGSKVVKRLLQETDSIVTSALSYVEAKSVFPRKKRERGISKRNHRKAIELFNIEWDGYFHVEVSKDICIEAGALTESYPLKAYDAVHLASYMFVKKNIAAEIKFSSFDNTLNRTVQTLSNFESLR